MDIDKLFKVPKLPAGGNKRRLPDNPSPELLKKLRTGASPEQPSVPAVRQVAPKRRQVTVEDEDEDMDKNVDKDFAPGGDADYFAEEDDEGRFFGGGLTGEQKEILNIFESAGAEGAEEDGMGELSITGIRRLLLRFERAVSKNQDQRSKYPDDPTKFIDSEADLDSAIKALLPLAQVPVLAYPELVKSGVVTKLIGLLTHENADIMIDVVEVIHELTDEDVGNEAEEYHEDERTPDEALRALIDALLENSILELLVDNLSRLNESEEADKQGVFHMLGIFENVLGIKPTLATDIVSKTTILAWLLTRIQSKEFDENKGYAAELISILLQNNRETRLELGKKDGIETILKILSLYRRRDPKDADETEYMENVFDALCSALNEPEIKKQFLESEGVDLMVLIMKEKGQARLRSIKALDFAMTGVSGVASCEAFVEALGLKTLFSAFMGKSSKHSKGGNALSTASEDMSHMLGILSSLFSNLAFESPARVRLLAKFVEGNYEKVDRLLEIRDNAEARLKAVDKSIRDEKNVMKEVEEELEEDAIYLRRLDGGLFTLQNVDFILASLAAEDEGICSHIIKMLERKNKKLGDIIATLCIYLENIEEEKTIEEGESVPPSRKEYLQGLIDFLIGLQSMG